MQCKRCGIPIDEGVTCYKCRRDFVNRRAKRAEEFVAKYGDVTNENVEQFKKFMKEAPDGAPR